MRVRNLWSILRTPEYALSPRQLLRRLTRSLSTMPPAAAIRLPWGLDLTVQTADAMGLLIWEMGVYDLVLCEAIWRLLDPGEAAMDVGAYVGYVSSLMAARTGPSGQVAAFEPFEASFAALAANASRWARQPDTAAIAPHRLALSDRGGQGLLGLPETFASNRGVPTLAERGTGGEPIGERVAVQLARLDDLAGERPPALIKIDVEGHEAQVLAGGEALFTRRAIRDVVFEDHDPYPSPAMAFLQARDYALFYLGRTFWGPELLPPDAPQTRQETAPPSFLATADPGRALARFQPRGWRVLRGR